MSLRLRDIFDFSFQFLISIENTLRHNEPIDKRSGELREIPRDFAFFEVEMLKGYSK